MEAISLIKGSPSQADFSEQSPLRVESPQRPSDASQAPDTAGKKSVTQQIQAGEETVRRIAEAMDSYVRSIQNDLEIRIHEDTGTVMVKVISHETGEVIREIPPEELIDLAAKMEEMMGVLFQKRV